ncbi:hypothetical protein C0584_01645 [Candidatus Parcubacteria bacterium]|nr:MAG: hypothetical protein C0584_01645 [Candidatus Parcubacteria bacterium]
MLKNKKGNAIIILLVVFSLIGLAYLFSFKNNDKAVENILGDTGLIEKDSTKNSYSQALDAAKKLKYLQMRPIDESDYHIGNLDAPVKIIYYSDFECPFCPDYVETLNTVLEEYSSEEVVFAFRHFILSNHSFALDAALAFECGVEQTDFMDMYLALYEDSKNQTLTEEEYLSDAEDLGLDTEQFSDCLKTEKYKQKIDKLVQEARNFGVTGTPSTFLNGKPLAGAYPYEDFVDQLGQEKEGLKTIIDKELAKPQF